MMPLDYKDIALKYRPLNKITTLLIGEAPPPNGLKYFYLPSFPIKKISLPSTIFSHYFGKLPQSSEEYHTYLDLLKHNGIFLIDICETPLQIRIANNLGGINQDNLEILISHIPNLREKINEKNIEVDEENIVFLLARRNYRKILVNEFPNSKLYSWKEFRESRELINGFPLSRE